MPDRALRLSLVCLINSLRQFSQKTPNARQGITTKQPDGMAMPFWASQKTPNARQGITTQVEGKGWLCFVEVRKPPMPDRALRLLLVPLVLFLLFIWSENPFGGQKTPNARQGITTYTID